MSTSTLSGIINKPEVWRTYPVYPLHLYSLPTCLTRKHSHRILLQWQLATQYSGRVVRDTSIRSVPPPTSTLNPHRKPHILSQNTGQEAVFGGGSGETRLLAHNGYFCRHSALLLWSRL